MAAVFAREMTPALTSLVKKLEQATVDHKDAKVAAWVVVLTDDDKVEGKLKELADKDADVTVLLYEKKTVKKNHVFEKGKFTEKDADKIAAEVKEVLATK